jgi:DNA polymerase III epsilon subunit-like protein
MAYVKGYSKAHPGKYGILLDWETTGSTFGGDSSIEYQGIAYGAVICDLTNFTPVETLYRELHFDDTKYKWTEGAEKIHGLSREHLLKNGVSREEGLRDLAELLLRYFAPGSKILIMGHNVSFDADFTHQLFKDFGLEIVFHHVMVDTSGIGFVLTGEYKSDVVFEILGGIDKRGLHNALDDALATLSVLRTAREIFIRGLEA